MKLKNVKNITSEKNLNKLVGAYNDRSKRRIFIIGVVVFCIVLAIVFLYQPARDLYVSSREHDRLSAQLELLKQTNQNLQNDIEQLQTEEGIKQRATDMLGLIESGDSIGFVEGNEYNDGRENSANSTSSKLAYKNIKTPTT